MTTLLATLLSLIMNVDSAKYVDFTLRNESAKSIPLIIPNVMNPNLSPMSNSGVKLQVGQEVYFFPKGKKPLGKKEILLVVDESLKGKVLKVNELIKLRIKELEEENG